MYQYELQQVRAAELIRRAAHERLVREAARSRRSARRQAGPRAATSDPHTDGPRRNRFVRTA